MAATPHCDALPFRAQTAAPHEHEWVYAWSTGGEVQTGIVEINDYDFEKPSQSGAARSRRARAAHAALRCGPSTRCRNTRSATRATTMPSVYAHAHVEAHQAANVRVSGRTTARGIWPGGLVQSDRASACASRTASISSCRPSMNSIRTTILSTLDAARPAARVRLRVHGAAARRQAFRAARSTPRARVAGPQTAVVVGPSGEEIHTDKYGRIKVQFHWEQFATPEASRESLQRCWVRVAQPWAGKGYGAFFLPRIGQEVLVDFIEGDPDQPLVIGQRLQRRADARLTNCPRRWRARRSRAIRRKAATASTKCASTTRKDAEQLFFHAERDLDTWVKHDALMRIGHERHVIVEQDDYARCGGNRSDARAGQSSARDRRQIFARCRRRHAAQVRGEYFG